MPTRHPKFSLASSFAPHEPRSQRAGRRLQNLSAAMVMAMLLSPLSAQVLPGLQFAELAKRHLPHTSGPTVAVALGDVDGDGDLDMVEANYAQQTRLYRNDGTGLFADGTAGRMPVASDNTLAVALGDVDADGDLDLVVGNVWQSRLYLNNGTGTFTDATAARMPVDSDYTTSVALGDVDGDGDLDLVLGDLGGQNRLYLNNGTGTFTDATAGRMPVDFDFTQSVACGDVDGDGDLDLVMGNDRQPNRLYLNQGLGSFTDATATRMPLRTDTTNDVALGDVDGDGDLDLVLGNGTSTAPQQSRLYLNNGTGTFADATASRLPTRAAITRSVAVGDVDGDGDLDVLVGNVGSNGEHNRLYRNDGTGTFTDDSVGRLPADGLLTTSVALGDVDADGDLDSVIGNGQQQTRLYLNRGTGSFVDADATRMPWDRDNTRSVALGDVDADGDLDMVTGNVGDVLPGQQNRLYENDGTGAFTDVTSGRLPVRNDETAAVVIGDVDGDGALDLIVGNDGEQNRLLLNTGAGAFTDGTATRMPVDLDRTQSLALGDVDADGDLDLVVGNGSFGAGQQDRLYLNNGTGTFTDATATGLPVDSDSTRAVVLVDVDGDRDLDLVAGNLGQQNRLYLNSGTGTFTDATASRMPVDSDVTSSLAFGDVDRDGDLDMLVGNLAVCGSLGCTAQQNRLYRNDGTGTFTDATAGRLPAVLDFTTSVALGDVDGDGDLDAVTANVESHANRMYLNDGSGTFVDATTSRLPEGMDLTYAVVLGDIDGDGDLDVVYGNSGQDRCYTNLQRQIVAPYLLRIGQRYTLEAYSRYSTPGLFDVALAYLSTARRFIPWPPFGTLGIDPMVALPPVLIPQPAGVAATSYDIPNDPAFVGVAIYAQAAIVPWPFDFRLTNVTADTILR